MERSRRAIGPHGDFIPVAQKADPENQRHAIHANTRLLSRQHEPFFL
jgi:hypothetical protein